MSIIDTATDSVVDTVRVGASPFGVAVHPSGTEAYVTNSGDGTLSVIDAAAGAVRATVPIGSAPGGLGVSPDGNVLYVAYGGSLGNVAVLATTDLHVLTRVPVGEDPMGVAVHPDGSRVYVTTRTKSGERRPCNINPVTFCDVPVAVIETEGNTVVAKVPMGDYLDAIEVMPSGASAYVLGIYPIQGTPRVVLNVLDTATNAVTHREPLPAFSITFAVAFHPGGHEAYVSTLDSVLVIDTESTKVRSRLLTGFPASGIALHPDGSKLYVAHEGGLVSVVDTARRSVMKQIEVGHDPVAFGRFIARTTAGPSTPTSTPSATPSSTNTVTQTPSTVVQAETATTVPTITPPATQVATLIEPTSPPSDTTGSCAARPSAATGPEALLAVFALARSRRRRNRPWVRLRGVRHLLPMSAVLLSAVLWGSSLAVCAAEDLYLVDDHSLVVRDATTAQRNSMWRPIMVTVDSSTIAVNRGSPSHTPPRSALYSAYLPPWIRPRFRNKR